MRLWNVTLQSLLKDGRAVVEGGTCVCPEAYVEIRAIVAGDATFKPILIFEDNVARRSLVFEFQYGPVDSIDEWKIDFGYLRRRFRPQRILEREVLDDILSEMLYERVQGLKFLINGNSVVCAMALSKEVILKSCELLVSPPSVDEEDNIRIIQHFFTCRR